MRIAYVSADFGIPVQGNKGSSVHVREMVHAFARQGHEIQVFTPNPGAGNMLQSPLYLVGPGDLPDRSSSPIPWSTNATYARLRKEVRELRFNFGMYRAVYPQLAAWSPHCVYERYSLFSLGGLALARRLGVPHILEVNAPLREERIRTIGLTFRRIADVSDGRVFRGATRLLVVSHALRSYVLRRGAAPEHITVLPNGVDTIRFTPARVSANLRQSFGIEPDAFVVGFSGSLKPWHGVDLLLDAFAHLRTRNSKMRLLIVGNGPQRDALVSRTADLGITESVIFTGSVPHHQMASMLGMMDVGVAPYLDIPNFYFSPLKLFEYMATGLPIVASNAGEISTIVQHGESGLLFSPGNVTELIERLSRIMSDCTFAAHLGSQARCSAEQHSWDRNAQTVIDLLHAEQRSRTTPARASLLQEQTP
jgi:glycosyltransferase involved in cell wall biosynthesis